MSQSIALNSAERLSIAVGGEYPHLDTVSLNLYLLKNKFFQGEEIKIELPEVIVHVPRDGNVLAMNNLPFNKEQRAELLAEMAGTSRDVLQRLRKSINRDAKICCDYEVAQALMMFSDLDGKK